MRSGAGVRTARSIAIVIPAALLAGALGFQFLGGLPPCEMCVWQRWPHVAAIALALGSFACSGSVARVLIVSAGFAILVSALVGGFHAGVEYRWWEGVTACTAGGGAAGRSDAEILADIMATPIVRCDVAPWSLLGVSLAGWNAVLSGVGGLLVLLLTIRDQRSQ